MTDNEQPRVGGYRLDRHHQEDTRLTKMMTPSVRANHATKPPKKSITRVRRLFSQSPGISRFILPG
jgi:hypothetical protein